MAQHGKISFWMKTKRFANECWRVLKVTRKPDRNEFRTIVKVSALGMLVIGMIGFIITMTVQFIK